ncbi:peroxiredoxin [Caldalkalibacillus mannanilyticus]|uniref:peroxiredoxin n=1 Tax=Caldalkalibacillus mannanilyticus TaxID=1418 RepID=UPI0004685563|nr:peroxiredoxin [Caldalkalibacillus mannanilyticus]
MEHVHRTPLGIGDRLPQLEVHTTHGKIVLPTDYEGRWFMLFSHPGDFTPVCTTEFVSFAKNQAAFQQLNCELIGLSIDTVFAHMKWIEWIQSHLGVSITFPIIADELGVVARRLGMIPQEGATRTVRSVFIVDPSGSIRLILTYPSEVGRNTNELLRVLKGLQTADTYRIATPANWPNNELIGDRVILPPANTVMKARERLEQAAANQFECLDWWFCYQEIPNK